MSKKKTKELLNEVINHINKEMGFEVMDSYSDFGNKFPIVKRNPCFLGHEQNKILTNRHKYFMVCEFSVFKNYRKEEFIVWDSRERQPLFDDVHCVYDMGFGKYVFTDKKEFYSYVSSDFGLTPWDRQSLKEDVTIIVESND
jgi:radical SAM superfamily enzyme with C-terminal helix-hairpin-helix motif